MQTEIFNQIIEEQIDLCKDTLISKAKEYATEDRLHNFKTAAALQHESPKKALSGMMAKHTVSVYDMCNSDEDFTTVLWEEKITDHINYLLLLKAVVMDEKFEGNPNSMKELLRRIKDQDGLIALKGMLNED